MSGPRFSVVVPVHNKERHVARAMRSILDQTQAPHEIILIDDASSDGSIAMLRSMADDRTMFLRRDEPGPGGYAARNLGIERATGDWIAFLDADDYWLPDHLASLAAALAHAGEMPGCVFAGYRFQEPSGPGARDWYSGSGRGYGLHPTPAMLDLWLEGGCPLWTGAVAIRRATLIDAGLFPAGLARRGGDRDLWLRTMLRTPCVATGAVTAIYCRDADNMLTKAETFSFRQRILDTIATELPGADAAIAARLRRIYDREVFQYALKAWKSGVPVTPAMTRGFYAADDRPRAALIALMRAVPLPFAGALGRRYRAGRAWIARRGTSVPT